MSYSPHAKGGESVNSIMWNVVIALIPALIAAIWFFGIGAITVTLTAVFSCIITEWAVQKYILKTRVTALDGSAVITGMLLAFNLPSSIPLWMVIAASIFAIGIAKQTFGGLGKNPVNPALAARIFLLVCFPVEMTTWPVPGVTRGLLHPDAVTAATPLGMLKEGIKSGHDWNWIVNNDVHAYFDWFNLFIGNRGGSLGEVSALAILIGGIFLIARKVITWHIPVFYIGTVFAFSGIFHLINPGVYAPPLFHILAGGMFLGAFFMATDYVTSPMTIKGQIVFAVGAGILLVLIRLWGGYPEGCSFSILIMNCFTPLINKYMKPARFGEGMKHVA